MTPTREEIERLIERLRTDNYHAATVLQAADALSALLAENEELRYQVKALTEADGVMDKMDEVMSDLEYADQLYCMKCWSAGFQNEGRPCPVHDK